MAHKPMNQTPSTTIRADSTVDGSHRAGKRKRGNSVTKLKPREATKAVKMDVHDSDGRIIALGVKMITSKPDLTEDQWNGLAPITLGNRALPALPSSSGKAQGTTGSRTVRKVTPHTTANVDCGAVARFLTVCAAILAEPETLPDLPADYVPRTYAASKAIPRDRFGR